MKTSVIISTYDRPEDLVNCLQSLQESSETPDEIIVVDDGDVQRTRERLTETGIEDVTHIEGDGGGLPASRNHGVAEATGDVICFVDDDVVVPPNWLREIRRTYETEDVDGVGGYVCNYNPRGINKADVDSWGYRALTSLRLLFAHDRVGDVSPLGILWAPHTFMVSGTRRVETLQGCNMSFRSDVFDEYAFSEWYGTEGSAACEEIDFCSRVSAGGYTLGYNPRAVVLHKRSVDNDSRTTGPNYDNITNLTYFVMRHPRLGYANVALLALMISIYALLRLDPGYVWGVLKGVVTARRNERATEGDR